MLAVTPFLLACQLAAALPYNINVQSRVCVWQSQCIVYGNLLLSSQHQHQHQHQRRLVVTFC